VADSRREPLDPTPGVHAGYACALLAILLVAALLRVYGLRTGLWLDELISGWVVADGFSAIPSRSWMANLSPLFFYVLRLSTGLLGFSEPALRLPSVLGGLALVALVPAWLRSLGVGRGSCLACAALVAIDPALLAPSTWARPYALVMVASLAATIGFQRIVLEGSRRVGDRALFVVAHALGLYLHYVTIALLGWQLIYAAMLWLRGQDLRFAPRSLAIDTLWIGLLCLPSAPHLAHLALGHATLEFTRADRLAGELNRYLVVELLVIPAFASGYFAFCQGQARWLREEAFQKHLPLLRLLGFLYVVPLLVFWGLSKANLAHITLYSRYCAPLPILMLGLVSDAIAGRAARRVALAAAFVFVGSVEVSPARSFLAEGRFSGPYQEWKQAVAQLRSDGAAGDVVFVDPGLVEERQLGADSPEALRSYVLMPVTGLYSLAGTGMQTRAISETWVPTDPGTLEAVRSAARVWVLAPNGHPGAARTVSEALARAGIPLRLQEVRKLEGPTLSVLTPSAAAAPAVPGAHD
jgi:hypothetical protein